MVNLVFEDFVHNISVSHIYLNDIHIFIIQDKLTQGLRSAIGTVRKVLQNYIISSFHPGFSWFPRSPGMPWLCRDLFIEDRVSFS